MRSLIRKKNIYYYYIRVSLSEAVQAIYLCYSLNGLLNNTLKLSFNTLSTRLFPGGKQYSYGASHPASSII